MKSFKAKVVATSTSSTGVIVATGLLCTLTTLFAAFVVTSSPIDPIPLLLPRFHRPARVSPGKLGCVEKLGEGLVQGPEDVVLTADGTTLLVTTRDGWVKKVFAGNGSVVNWRQVGGYPCGLAIGVHGEVLVADPVRGLLNVSECDGKVRVVTNLADGKPLTYVSLSHTRNPGCLSSWSF